jgi:hypothetical protein
MATIASYITNDQGNFINSQGDKVGQSLTSTGIYLLDNVTYRVSQSTFPGPVSGTLKARVYGYSGTYGVDSIPDGLPLAESDAVSISSLVKDNHFTSAANKTFIFSGSNRIVILPGIYVVTLEADVLTGSAVGFINTATGAGPGNQSRDSGSGWVGSSTFDMRFILTGTPHSLLFSTSGSSSATATGTITHYLSVEGAFGFSGSATALIEVDNEATERKTYMYKVYDLNDDFIGIWDDAIDPFNYSQEVNSAGSSTYVRLARNSDSLTTTTENLLDSDGVTIDDSEDRPIQTTVKSRNQIGPGSTVNHNYRVDVYVFYGELSPILDSNGAPILDSDDNPILGQSGAPNGRRIFTGFISEIESKYGDDETTLVELTSFGFDLDQYVIETDIGDTTVPFNSYDPSDIVSEAMEDFNSREGIMNVTAQSVETTGTTVSYTFRVNTYLEVLQKAVELAPSDWFWYADLGQNLIYFRERPSTPSHLFYLGEHLENLKLRSYIGDAVNDVYFSGGQIDDDPVTNLFKRYTQTPATNTRVGLRRLNDNRVILEDSAQILSEGEMDRNNRIQYRSEITILSQVYDIEDISLGDLIGFRNFDNYVDDLTMQIVRINYAPEKVTLSLDTLLPRVSKRLEDLRRNMDAIENENNPVAPTV